MRHSVFWVIRFHRIPFVLLFCVLIFLVVMLYTFEDDVGVKRKGKMFLKTELDEISCYYKTEGDVLQLFDETNFAPNSKSIFYIDSTCKGRLTMSQACVAESAAAANPEWAIYLLFIYPITDSLSKKYLKTLLTFPNINAARIHITKYAKDTVLESILVNDINKSRHPIEDATNMLKIVTLHRFGGVSLDNDMLVLRPFDDLPKNWVVKKNNGLSSELLSFAENDVGRNVTSEIMKELVNTFNPKSRHFIRLEAILFRVLKKICPNIVTSKAGECNGLKLFSEDMFYPIAIPSPTPIPFEPEKESAETDTMPYTYHLKNMDFSSYLSSEEWPFETLSRIFCPVIFETRLTVNNN